MPIMNGFEFIQKAKEIAPDIRYFILTGFDISPEIIEAFENKTILKYFKKPFIINDIQDTLLEYCV